MSSETEEIISSDSSVFDVERRVQQRLRHRRILIQILRVGLLAAALAAWELCGRTGITDPFFYSMPSAIALQLWAWVKEGTSQGPLWLQVLITLEETGLGFLIGSILGVICGIALGRNRLLADVFSVYIKVANSVPRIVLGSVFIMALGLGMASKVALAVVMVFFVVFGNAFQGVREADRNLIANAHILGATKWQVTSSVVLPSAMTWILASLHVSFGFALVGAVVGEFLGSRQGIGLLIATAQNTFNSAGVFAAMIVLAAVALLAEFAITRLENLLLKWRPPQFTDTGY